MRIVLVILTLAGLAVAPAASALINTPAPMTQIGTALTCTNNGQCIEK